MNYLSTIFLALLSFAFFTLHAHEGHDHGAPTFQAPKGGILKSASHGHFELIKKDNVVSIYAYTNEGKSIETKNLQLAAELELPRKKAAGIALIDKKTHWETIVDSQGAHRFTLKVSIDDGKEKDYVKFTVENK